MTKTLNAFGETDLTRFFTDLKLPGLDLTQVADFHRKNLETFAQAGQAVVEGAQAIGKRQIEYFTEAASEAAEFFHKFGTPTSPEAFAAKQTEILKQSLETGLARLNETAELIGKANNAAVTVINKRVAEALKEVTAFSVPNKAKAA